MSQKQIKKPDSSSEKDKKETKVKPVDEKKAGELKDNMDKLLDEIDDILEKDSEEFLKSYVQKGGE